MKNIVKRLSFLLIFSATSTLSFSHVYLDYPYGGETFMANTIITIQWHIAIPHEQLNWDLYFSTDGGNSWQPIQLDLPVSQLTYTWVVPSIETSLARISIIQDNVDMDYQHESMDFTIEPMPNTPFIDITAQDLNILCNISNQQSAIDAWLNNQGGAVAVGFCGELTWTHDFYAITNECGATGESFVTFTAEDECGTAVTSAYVRVYDLEAPAIQSPASDVVWECTGPNNILALNKWLMSNGGAVAHDACGNLSWSNNFTNLTNDCSSTGSVTVIFTATDDCGNSSTSMASFTIEDHTSPQLNIPAQQKVVNCSDTTWTQQLQAWLESHGSASAHDACGELNWSHNYSGLNEGCGNTGSAAVTFSATDECGNFTQTEADFIVADNISPLILSGAKDTILDCTDDNAIDNWLETHAGAEAMDECGTISWTNDFNIQTDTCDATQIFPVIFTATDECGNTSFTTATLTLQSTTNSDHPSVEGIRLKISPNPVNDILNIEMNKDQYPVQLHIFDINGKSVLVNNLIENVIELDVSALPDGIYFIRISSRLGTVSEKIIIF